MPHPNQEGIREHFRALCDRMQERVVGHDAAVRRLALVGALHLARAGGRCLLIGGPNAVGKSHIVEVLVAELQRLHDVPARLPHSYVDAASLVAPGWGGGRSIGAVLGDALDACPVPSLHPYAVVVIDDAQHLRSPGEELDSNVRRKHDELLASLRPLLIGGTVRLDGGNSWPSGEALVLLVGTFPWVPSRLTAQPVQDLMRVGFPDDIASRLAADVVTLDWLDEDAVASILETWPSARRTIEAAARIGLKVSIAPECLGVVARRVTSVRHAWTVSVAGERIRRAVEEAMLKHIEHPEPGHQVTIGPDDVAGWRRR